MAYKDKDEVKAMVQIRDGAEMENLIDGADYDSGCLEAAQETATRASRGLVKLLITLLDKKALTDSEAVEILEAAKYRF